MAASWKRRTALALATASLALLTACGSSTTESALRPERFVAFGDGMADVGQNGVRYTVNDGSVNNWTLQLASRYGQTLTPASAGGTSYAVGNARVVATPDAAGNASTPTVQAQIDRFLAQGGKFGPNDVVMVNAGVSDVIAEMAAVTAQQKTAAQMVTSSRQAGEALAGQVRRLINAGAKYVIVSDIYNLGRSPWAKAIGQTALLGDASTAFNEGLKVSLVDQGGNVLYVDQAFYVNIYVDTPANLGFSNGTTPICTSVDANNSLGIGSNQVSSTLCTPQTLLPNAKLDSYVFADSVYLTPNAHRVFGNYAYDRLRLRW